MADENGQVEETQTEDTNTEEQHPAQTESEFMDETIADIKETQKAIQEQEESVEEKTEDETAEDNDILEDLAGTDIPDEFTEAAEAAGMTAEDIIALADKTSNEDLLALIPTLTESLEEESGNTDNKQEDITADAQQQIIEQVTKQLEEKFGVSLDELEKFKTQQAAREDAQNLVTVNQKFDEAAKEFDVFGKTEELPRFTSGKLKGQYIPTAPAVKARMEVLQNADVFVKAGRSVEDAMDDALALYAGRNLRKEMERSLIKDLKEHEKQLSGGRIGKETKKKYADSREEIIDEIRQLQRQAGIDV